MGLVTYLASTDSWMASIAKLSCSVVGVPGMLKWNFNGQITEVNNLSVLHVQCNCVQCILCIMYIVYNVYCV